MNRTDPSAAAASLWLQSLSRNQLHEQGWIAANQRFHGLSRAVRPYIREHFTPEEQEAAFDGFTLALYALSHFEDIEALARLLQAEATDEQSQALTGTGE